MHSMIPDNLLVTLLRQCYSNSSCHRPSKLRALRSITQRRTLHISTAAHSASLQQFKRASLHHATNEKNQLCGGRTYATSTEHSQPPNEIAVLGGGITGLASAFYLTKELPDAKITLYEAGDTLGGWMRTKHVNVGNGEIIFEQGPRTLRASTPAGALTLTLARDLGLEDEIIATSRNSVAATNRFIYYPDRLVTMPSPTAGFYNNLWSILTEPVFGGFSTLVTVGWEYWRPRRPEDLQDESVGSFLRRRLGTSKIGDNIVSAVLHGIYAGDIEKLSIKSLLPRLWDDEGTHESLTAALGDRLQNPQGKRLVPERDLQLWHDWNKGEAAALGRMAEAGQAEKARQRKRVNTSSVYSFKRGIGSFPEALENYLKGNPNVEIKKGHEIDGIVYEEKNNSILIKSKDESTSFSRVISTMSGHKLSPLVVPSSKKDGTTHALPTLALTPSVTVMVVNLYFTDPDILPAHGFGYLIPRSIPFEQNLHCALGVVFDSDATVGQDGIPGTKVTVMMGGHWWDDYLSTSGNNTYPTEDEGAFMAKAVLKKHLGIEEEPAKVLVSLQKDCIPQYTVGHEERMRKANQELLSGFGGRLAVAGNSYTGVGVNDCVRAARDVAVRIKDATAMGGHGIPVTGLEHFLMQRKYVLMTPFVFI